MKTKIKNFSRRRLEILNTIISLGTKTYFSCGSFPIEKEHSFISCYSHSNEKLIEGDLVSLESVFRTTKYYLSFYRGIRNENQGFPEYLLESIEDGSLCWWSNVSFRIYDRESKGLNWDWDDDQFAFHDKAKRVAANYSIVLLPSEFDGNRVTLKKRRRWEDFNPKDTIQFDDYRKVTIKMIKPFFIEK